LGVGGFFLFEEAFEGGAHAGGVYGRRR
jgi:hypothetical protein